MNTMTKTREATPWYYYVRVSKDSPKNAKSGDFNRLPDTEYHRGYYELGAYTTLKEAKAALGYYQKGFVEKRRTVNTWEPGRGFSSVSETIKVLEL